jgi:hypothetical protein
MDRARILLEAIPALQRHCDLDLVVFFARHPHTLTDSKLFALLLGYPLNEIAQSLDTLLAAGLLTQAQHPTCQARMYVFAAVDTNEALRAIVELAATREGRSALRRALALSPAGRRDTLAPQAADDAAALAGTRPFLVGYTPEATAEPSSDEQRRRRR